MEDQIKCPLIDDMIDIGDCVVCSDVARGMIKEDLIPDRFKKKNNWGDICSACKYHNM